MLQNGDDNEGILGFLESDIRECIKKDRLNRCYYCSKKAATIFCRKKGCRRTFHLPCGLKHNCLFQFHGEFFSFCDKHWEVTDKAPYQRKNEQCYICFEHLPLYHPLQVMPLCCKNRFTHIRCMKKYALSAGYYFKCMLCPRPDAEFTKLVRSRGVYVPDQDAVWERSSNAYQSLMFTYEHCDATRCLNSQENGREFGEESISDPWHILICKFCGSSGAHRACNAQATQDGDYACHLCSQKQAIDSFIDSDRNHNLEPKIDDRRGEKSVNNDISFMNKTGISNIVNLSKISKVPEIKKNVKESDTLNDCVINLTSTSESSVSLEKLFEEMQKKNVAIPKPIQQDEPHDYYCNRRIALTELIGEADDQAADDSLSLRQKRIKLLFLDKN